MLALTVLLVVLVGAGARYLPQGADRGAFATLLLATLAMLGPLLVVTPIGPRNVYGPTVTLLACVALLARPVLEPPTRRMRGAATGVIAALCLAGTATLFVIQRANSHVAAERVAIMAAAVESRAQRAELPAFPHPTWVHHPNDKKIAVRYFRERPRDITVIAR